MFQITTSFDITTSKSKVLWPVGLDEAKDQLNIRHEYVDKDLLLQGYIKAATRDIENMINKDIALTRNVSQIWSFSGDIVKIVEAPFIEIESLKDSQDASVAWNVNETRGYYEYWILKTSGSITSDPLTVTYLTGWTPDACPEELKQAILIRVADFFNVERESYSPNIRNNQVIERLVSYYMPTQMRF
jgi:hypothetical protein